VSDNSKAAVTGLVDVDDAGLVAQKMCDIATVNVSFIITYSTTQKNSTFTYLTITT